MPLRQPTLHAHLARAQAALTPARQATRMADLHWGAAALQEQLAPLQSGLRVEVLARCASTNTLLIERARGGDTTPCLLLALEQTQGRGRLGRSWQSGDASTIGASLTFSLAMPLAPRDWQGLSLAVGVALADALEPQGARIGLKWPNDLWLVDAPGRGRKLAGILIETVAAAGQHVAVVGVGINVLPLDAGAPSTGYACLQELQSDVDASAAWARVAAPLLRALQGFEAHGLAPFVDAFTRRDLLRGQPIQTTQPGAEQGLCEGIDAQGALLLRAGSALHAIHSGEVSVRPVAPASSCSNV